MGDPVIIGVRHHSPACARLVATRLRELRPAYVLIEGPADMNPRLGELLLGHRPPIAIYSYLSGMSADGEAVHHGSWTPLDRTSPEWQALIVGTEVGADVRFCDLPAWHPAMSDMTDRYAEETDEQTRDQAERYEAALARRLGTDNHDATWDTLFEDTEHLSADEVAERLAVHFEHLRAGDPGSIANGERERTMASWVAWAVAQDRGPVIVVCGGYHAPAIARLWPEMPTTEPVTPLPSTVGPDVRHGSYLVPYSHRRLDAFAGYGAGMPSPGYYDDVFAYGLERAGRMLLETVVRRLRAKNLPASTAHLVAVVTRADALRRMRGHRENLRQDWLDAIAGTLVDDALDAPLPWSYRGPLLPGTDPVLVEVVAALAGDETGELAAGTPRPPLIDDVEAEFRRLEIKPTGEVTVDLFDATGVARSQVLHRLSLLAIPGITRRRGPDRALSGTRDEVWRLSRPAAQEPALIEAGAYGATLADAATAKLTEVLAQAATDVGALAQILNQAAFAGLADVSAGILPVLREAIASEQRLSAVGEALAVLHPVLRHGSWLDLARSPLLATVVAAAVDRALWLLEPPAAVPTAEVSGHLRTMIALRDVARDALTGPPIAGVRAERLVGVFRRKAADTASAPVSRGAAVGALADLAPLLDDASDLIAQAVALLDGLGPQSLGDALSGLVVAGRESLLTAPGFVTGIDAIVNGLAGVDFVEALPAMRGAFAWLPARERVHLAEQVAGLYGGSRLALTAPLAADPILVARAAEAEQRVFASLARWGLA